MASVVSYDKNEQELSRIEVRFLPAPVKEDLRSDVVMMVIQDSVTGKVLTAHDDKKHVYWSSSDNPWTWEFFTVEDDLRLMTAHGTYMWYDDENTKSLWQYSEDDANECGDDDTEDPLVGSLYVTERPTIRVAEEEPEESASKKKPTPISTTKSDSTPAKTEKDAFNRFCKEQRPEVKSENPGMKLVEQNKILKEMWEQLDDDTKQEYFA